MIEDNRTWTDQPDEVVGLPVLMNFNAYGAAFEVRRDKLGRYYVSAGNLFGSETVHADDVDGMFKLLAKGLNAARRADRE